MPDITVNLSDGLFGRLEAVKENVDVSDICRNAINSVVTVEEAKSVALSDREAVIIRLKSEASQAFLEWHQKGQCAGFQLAPTLSFAEIQQALLWRELQDVNEENDAPFYLFDLIPFDSFLVSALDMEVVPSYVSESYVLGALDGIVKFWESIEIELAASIG